MIRRRGLIAGAAITGFASNWAETEQARAEGTQLINSHVHVWKHDPAFPFAAGAHPPAQDASAEMLLDLMKANGVARTVIIQVIHYRWDNTYLSDVLRRYPTFFHGVCRVNPEDPAAPDELRRLTEEHGFRGVRLSPGRGAAGDWIKAPLMAPLWRRCAALRVPMTLLIPSTRIPDVLPLIEANPDLTVVIDHMADTPLDQPDQLEALLALHRFPRLFVKISHMWSLSRQAYPYSDSARQVRQLYDAFGAKRLMWGTDWPISLKYLPYAQAVALFHDHMSMIPAGDHAQILGQTVQEVWPFDL